MDFRPRMQPRVGTEGHHPLLIKLSHDLLMAGLARSGPGA
jgi:hypothetical protein